LDALSHLETFVETGLVAAALLLAAGCAYRSLRTPATEPKTGELVWTIVAIAVLAGAGVAAGLGGSLGV
jgi:hypothetical protein